MGFVDYLTVVEVLVMAGAALLTYLGVDVALRLRSGRVRPDELGSELRSVAVPLAAIGVASFALALWGEVVWPLPGAYNILFWDVFLLYSLVLLAFAATVYLRAPLRYFGLFALVAGATTIFYGVSGYRLNLTAEPFLMGALFVGFGGVGVVTFPLTVGYDWMVEKGRDLVASADAGANRTVKVRIPAVFWVLLILFTLGAFLCMFGAAGFVASSVPAHLQNPP
jgi:putative membrane protein